MAELKTVKAQYALNVKETMNAATNIIDLIFQKLDYEIRVLAA